MGNTHNKMVKDKNIRDAGLKVTLPRVRILEIFESSDQKHLSADEVYKKLIERKIITNFFLFNNEALRITPQLCITANEIDYFNSNFIEILNEL